MIARWPTPPDAWIDPRTETQFGTFLAVVAAIREIRARQNIPPKTRVSVAIRAPAAIAALLEPMRRSIESMGAADIGGLGPEASAPPSASTASAAGCELFVDLADLVDVDAEIVRILKENEKTEGFLRAKQAKLADEKFAARAPEAVVAKERAQLVELEAKLAKGIAALVDLRSRQGKA
jgi:valyl-tRNA synthetase